MPMLVLSGIRVTDYSALNERRRHVTVGQLEASQKLYNYPIFKYDRRF